MRNPIDGTWRRRIHLLRHAEVTYIDAHGQRVADTLAVDLTEHGRGQAAALGAMLAQTPIDKVICSGLPRTRQTAEIVAAGRNLPIDELPALDEIRSGARAQMPPDRVSWEAAYALWRAGEPEARFRNGERFDHFVTRIGQGLAEILAQQDWNDLLLVLHGAVNRAILCWALGTGLTSFPALDQDFCCHNLIDIDVDAQGHIARKVVRAINVTPYDIAKREMKLTSSEKMVVDAVALLRPSAANNA